MAQKKRHVFKGENAFGRWLEAASNVEGGTISPGGAKKYLNCSRQYVNNLVRRGVVESWVVVENNYTTYCAISIKDVIKLKEKKD